MAISHVEPAGVTGIPIGVTFDNIGKWWWHRPLDAWCARIPAEEVAATVSSNHLDSCGWTVWRDIACGIALESTWHANRAGCHAGKSTKLGPTIVEHWSDTCNWSNICIGRDLSTALKTTTALRVTSATTMSSESSDSALGITHFDFERHGLQFLDDLVQGGMRGVLRHSKVCQLHFLALHCRDGS